MKFFIFHFNSVCLFDCSFQPTHLILDNMVQIFGDLSGAFYKNFQILLKKIAWRCQKQLFPATRILQTVHVTYLLYFTRRSFAFDNFWPFRKAGCYDERICSFYRASIVNMKIRPRFVCLRPWVEFYGRYFCYQCATHAHSHHLFNIFIHTQPVYVAPHKCLHSAYSPVPGSVTAN